MPELKEELKDGKICCCAPVSGQYLISVIHFADQQRLFDTACRLDRFCQFVYIFDLDKNLVPELKEELKDGKIGISAAYEASRLEPERQQQIISWLQR